MKLPVCLILFVACGDSSGTTTPDGTPMPPDSNLLPSAKAVVVAGDYAAAGVFNTLEIDSLTMGTPNAAIAGADPVLRRGAGNALIVVNRFGGDNLTELSANLQVVDQWSTGAGSNPQDVATDGTRFFVATLGTPGVWASTGAGFALASLDMDGNPDCVAVNVHENKLYAACGVLDETFQPRGNGKLAVIDLATEQVVVHDLPNANPIGTFANVGDGLLISLVPAFNSFEDGCLATIPFANPSAATCLIDNSAMAGYVSRMSVADSGEVYVLVNAYSEDFSSETGSVHLLGATLGPALTSSTVLARDVAVCPLGGPLVVADDTENAGGLRVFERNGTERTTNALPIGLPPANAGSLECL